MQSRNLNKKVLDNKSINLQETKEKKLILKSLPTHIWLSVAGKCNLKCSHCLGIPGRGTTREKDLVDMDWEIFEKLERDLFPYVETCVLGGSTRGEQFYAQEWDRYYERLSKFPMKIEIVTNATLIKDYQIEKLVSHGVDFRISMDGANEETVKLIRGAKLSKIVDSISKINKARGNNNGGGSRIVINFAICLANTYELPSLIELGSQIGIDEICVLHLMPQIESQRYQSMFYHMDTYNRTVEKSKVLAEANNIKLDIPPPFDCGQITPKIQEKKEQCKKDDNYKYCLLPWNSVSIYNNGTIAPCCVGAMRELGNLNKQSFDEVWNGKRYIRLRKEMINQKQTRGCKNCSYRYFERSTGNVDAAILSDIGPAASFPVGILLRKYAKNIIESSPFGSKVVHSIIDYYRRF